MSVSRRRFLKSGAVLSAALMLKPGTLIFGQDSLWSNNSPNSVQAYSREMFAPYVGDVFRVHVGRQVVDLKLVALENLPAASRTDGFSLQFHAPKQLPSTAKIHNLNHKELGSFDLFMAQSKARGKFLHTAIVNHLI
jgi:hypothetical protein